MEKKPVIISLFDGMSCGQISLNTFLKGNYTYYASEIEESSIIVTQHNFPKTIQIGDVRDIGILDSNVFLLLGGSPCTDLSLMGQMKGMNTDTLEQYLELKHSRFEFKGQSYLFWEYARIKKESNPKYFLLENVIMNKKWQDIISNELGVEPIKINSRLLTAQNRDRLYWTNIPNVTVPKDKKIMLSNIIPGASGCGSRGRKNKITGKYVPFFTIRPDGKSNCIVTQRNMTQRVIFPNGYQRYLTIEEAEMLQTVPVGYTNVDGISKTDRYKMIGNGWTIDVISHILSFINYEK